MRWPACLILLLLQSLCCADLSFAAEPKTAATATSTTQSREQLEQQLAKTLSSCVLEGEFTVDGQPRDATAKKEKYIITSARKVQGDYWLLLTQIQYGKHDVTVPLTLQILWAGDTPVITLTDLTIPGLGTFTARVLIYQNRYVGTWQHGEVGGAMFGKISPYKAPAPTAKPAK